MSFLSDIATALAIILVSCGVNLTEISGGEVSVPAGNSNGSAGNHRKRDS